MRKRLQETGEGYFSVQEGHSGDHGVHEVQGRVDPGPPSGPHEDQVG